MPYPTRVRSLIGHFPCVADPPITNQCESPPLVRLPKSLFLWAISVTKAGIRDAQGAESGRRRLRDSGGEVGRAGGRNRDR